MSEDDFEHEHYDHEGPAYDRATAAYESALGKAPPHTQADHDAAYAKAIVTMEREHGRTSEEALAALYYLARFRNKAREWLLVFDRERERYGAFSAAAAGTLGWMADAFDHPDPRAMALYRWSIAMYRTPEAGAAWTGITSFVEHCAVEGWTPLLAAEARLLVTNLIDQAPASELTTLASETAEAVDEGTSWITALEFLGEPREAADLLEKLAKSAEKKQRAPLLKAEKKLRAAKLKAVTTKDNPLAAALELLEADKPAAARHAHTLLAKASDEPAFLRPIALNLRAELSIAVASDAVDTDLAALPSARATTLRAIHHLLSGRPEQATSLLARTSPRLAESDDPQRWEAFHASAAALGQWDVLDTWLDELRVESGLAPVPDQATLAVKRAFTVARTTPDRTALLREIYGVDLPDDCHALFDVARALSPKGPLSAFEDLELSLVGPFEVLAGLLDTHRPEKSMLLHWRRSYEVPEYLPLIITAEDRISHGYWFDDWSTEGIDRRFVVCSSEWEPVGRTAADLVRFEIERAHASLITEYLEGSSAERRAVERDSKALLRFLDRARPLLAAAGGSNDERVGDAYLDAARITVRAARSRVLVDSQRDMFIGIGGGPGAVKPTLVETMDNAHARAVGKKALASKDAYQALACGRRIWRMGSEKLDKDAFKLLDGAYQLLGREGVRRVLTIHHQDRFLPSVDLLPSDDDDE